MCGIFGVSNFKSTQLQAAQMALDSLAHRGPDQRGELIGETHYIGHRRLSINDLSDSGRQPMLDLETGISVSVNGEIYNYKSLRDELSKCRTFLSKSDSEVALHGYIAWGLEGLLERLDGMYAICIYDPKCEQVHLIRDRYGVKPLYWAKYSDQFIWASELEAILKYIEAVSGELPCYDNTAIYDFLTYNYVPSPKTLYKGIHKVEPSNIVTFDRLNRSTIKTKYWELPTVSNEQYSDGGFEKIRNALKKSVREQLIADVEIGIFLSGGVDSSIVSYEASQNSKRYKTFSIAFRDSNVDESHYAKKVANELGLEISIGNGETNNNFKSIKNWFQEPFGDTSCFPTYQISQMAAKEFKVVLSGDGGDELFGGYVRYSHFKKFQEYKKVPSWALKTLLVALKEKGIIPRYLARYLLRRFFLSDLELYTSLLGGMIKPEKFSYRKKLEIPDDYDDYWHFRKFYHPELPARKRMMVLDFQTYLPEDIFTKVDRVSMRNSLECRVPFMNRKLIECAFSLSERAMFDGGHNKSVLRQLYKKKLHESVFERPKKGFSIPTIKKLSMVGEHKNIHLAILSEFGIEI